MFECLGGTLASRAGGGAVAVPGGVGAEIALPRSHLVEASRREFVQPHERVGSERGAERVPGGIRCGRVPFFHEEVLALKLQLGIGAAPGWLGVKFTE